MLMSVQCESLNLERFKIVREIQEKVLTQAVLPAGVEKLLQRGDTCGAQVVIAALGPSPRGASTVQRE